MANRYLLGIDIGTSTSKAVLTDREGNMVATHSVAHEVSMPRPGHFEHDADAVWLGDLVALCSAIFTHSGVPPESIAAIGVSAIAPAVVVLDGEGSPLRPGILYGIDTRASSECAELSESLTDKDGKSLSFNSQSVVPKLLWLQRHEPEVWERTRLVLGAEGYLVYRLTGEATLDVYDADAYSPLFDTEEIRWKDEYPQLCSSALLPRLVWSTDIVGAVTEEAARLTGLAVGTPVVAGTADAAAETTSCGLAAEGDLMLMYGTSSFFILRTNAPSAAGTFWSGHFQEEGTFSVVGGMTISGGFPAWFAGLVPPEHPLISSSEHYDQLMRRAENSVPGAHGLVALPYLAGERSPFFDPFARGGFLGLTLRHNQGDLYRAVLESIGYGLRHIFEELEKEGHVVRRVLAVGGGAGNSLLMQLVCDIAGIEQLMPTKFAGAAYGDALRAGVGIGYFENLGKASAIIPRSLVVQPDVTHKDVYDRMYGIYRDFYSSTAPLMRRLGDLDA